MLNVIIVIKFSRFLSRFSLLRYLYITLSMRLRLSLWLLSRLNHMHV